MIFRLYRDTESAPIARRLRLDAFGQMEDKRPASQTWNIIKRNLRRIVLEWPRTMILLCGLFTLAWAGVSIWLLSFWWQY